MMIFESPGRFADDDRLRRRQHRAQVCPVSLARLNAHNVLLLLRAGEGHADLYRTAIAGPSGQLRDFLVGRVRYIPRGSLGATTNSSCSG